MGDTVKNKGAFYKIGRPLDTSQACSVKQANFGLRPACGALQTAARRETIRMHTHSRAFDTLRKTFVDIKHTIFMCISQTSAGPRKGSLVPSGQERHEGGEE